MKDDTILVGYAEGINHPPLQSKGKAIGMAELVKIQHFGSATIPARPFIEEGILSKKKELKDAIKKSYKTKIKTGKDENEKIAQKGVDAIQRLVRGGYYKQKTPNAKSTIREKGSDKPLIDTGLMINSLTYLVESKDQAKNISKIYEDRK